MAAAHTIKRVLIANRGEIARRIIRTCVRLNIETVAVYTEVDRYAPYVREATTSVALGSPDSYLSVDKIIHAAKESKADAIHPGYGFLSENPALPEACAKNKIMFIGPDAETMRALGSKTAAKSIAQKANVPTAATLLFSSDPLLPLPDQLKAFAERVGYPVILKAAAGGGGRGMRMITRESDLKHEIESAQRESHKAFGSAEIFAERCITPARHVEVQIAADQHGHVVALGTRDCTLQRSNQKIIEEAPAINLREGLSTELCDAACRLGKAAKYVNLGTVEFLVSPDGTFAFLEVNTRLQVEHPVTEMVTGLDLVEIQIRVAEGKKLSTLSINETPPPQGHAIEARLCAEDFVGQFVISTGIVQEFEVPTRGILGATVRVEAGVEPCSEVSIFYDSLIAKIIVHSESRPRAIAALTEVLSRSKVSGVQTNRSLLLHLLGSEAFNQLSHSIQGTQLLLPTDTDRFAQARLAHAIAAAYRAIKPRSTWAASSPWLSASADAPSLAYPWFTASSGFGISSKTTVSAAGAHVVCTSGESTNAFDVAIEDLFPAQPDGDQLRCSVSGEPHTVKASIRRDGLRYWVHLTSGTVALEERFSGSGAASGLTSHTGRELLAHIPGKVAATQVSVGQHVASGQVILVLDSMKMEHPIKAPSAGVVKELPVKTGSIVQSGSVLAIIEDD